MSISVIIPAFNAAATLPACIQSVDRTDVETVLIDDGSTDETVELVRDQFPDVHCLTQPNQGVSGARNEGIGCSGGSFLVFLDADDRLMPGALEKLSAYLDKADPDIVIMRSFSDGVERYPWTGLFAEGVFLTKDEVIRKGYVRGSVCGCAFRREYVMEHGLLFPEGIVMGEDLVFLSSALSAGGRVVFLDIPFYDVTQQAGSASRQLSPAFLTRYAAGLVTACRQVADPALKSLTCLSMMLGITRVGRKLGYGPQKTFSEGRFDEVLPLGLAGLKKDRCYIHLMNRAYPLLYYAQGIKDKLFR